MGRRIWVSKSKTNEVPRLALWADSRRRPVYSLILGTKAMIVLSSDVAVKELLDKRSGNYSDRPDMFIGQKVASGNLRLVVMVCDTSSRLRCLKTDKQVEIRR